MAASIIQIQRNAILETVRYADAEWKLLVVDEGSRKLIDNVTKEDDILNENVTEILQIEEPRQTNSDMDAVYFLSPLPHIVECLLADFEKRKYRRSFLLWTSILSPDLRKQIDLHPNARSLIASFRVLNVEFYPRESHLITLRDPWSFPVLYHPACNQLIRHHLEGLSQKIVSICVSLGEYPVIRYYRPRNPTHEASVLCSHLARMVQDAIDAYTQYHQDFPPPSPRPRGVLLIVDRSMDLFSPLLHEFTYQAMALDLLPIKDGDKVTYRTTINQGQPNEEVKDLEIGEKDKIWVANRHMHMKDLLEKLVSDFNKFRDENPQFAESTSNSTTVNTIKDMLAGLPQFQEGKEAYSLHLGMAQDCMKIFQEHKLTDMASVEQSLSTGLDEDYRKPKNLADQIVRLLDDESVPPQDRLRLIIQYLLYRDGLLAGDIKKLLAHAQLPPQDAEVIYNLDLLGARITKPLKDSQPPPQPLFARKPPPPPTADVSGLSRYDTTVKLMLEEQVRGTLDPNTFPFTRPHVDSNEGFLGQENASQASLRTKPTWARTARSHDQPKQRIIVFVAGGATYSESRSCYEISETTNKDVYLATSHMLSPSLYVRQLGDLGVDRRRLDIPADRPKPKPPAHLFERPQPSPPPPTAQQPQSVRSPPPPTAQMSAMNIKTKDKGDRGGKTPNGSHPSSQTSQSGGKLQKKDKEKKKHHFF